MEQVGGELRRRRRAARRVAVVLDYSDGVRCIRQAAARPATANDITLFETARQALFLAWARRVRVRHLRLVCDRLVFPPAQLALFRRGDRQRPKNATVSSAPSTPSATASAAMRCRLDDGWR